MNLCLDPRRAEWVSIDYARQLERELTASRRAVLEEADAKCDGIARQQEAATCCEDTANQCAAAIRNLAAEGAKEEGK